MEEKKKKQLSFKEKKSRFQVIAPCLKIFYEESKMAISNSKGTEDFTLCAVSDL